MRSMTRLLFLAAVAFGVLVPTQALAQDAPDKGCFITDTETVTSETPVPCVVDDGGVGGTDGGDAGGVGGVNRIDAGVGATAAVAGGPSMAWLLAAGAGVAGSVLRRRRR